MVVTRILTLRIAPLPVILTGIVGLLAPQGGEIVDPQT